MLQSINETLSEFYQKLVVQEEEASNIELEVRVGLLIERNNPIQVRSTHGIPGSGVFVINTDTTRFTSGVSHRDYETIKQQIGKKYKNEEISTHVSSFSYSNNKRVIFDEEALKLPFSEKKEKIHTVDIQLPAASYDLRFQASLETGKEEVTGTDPPDGWIQKRTKRRVSWTSPEVKYWKADLTLIEPSSGSGTWEVELELLPEAMVEWISNPHIQPDIATELFQLMEEINPSEKHLIITPTVESRVIKNKVLQTLKNKFGGKFPGTMPVSMRKRHVPDLQRSTSYRIAEKTDGVRYLMMTIQNTCVLIDRSKQVFKVDGGQFLYKILGEDTIIDGELVYNRTLNKSIFVAFDVLKLRGMRITTENFTTREKEVINLVQKYKKATRVQTPIHLELKMKTFYNKNEIMELFRNVSLEGHERIFKDSKGMHHKTDGIIFQPDSPYKVGTDENLLKWKWEDLASLDLRVRMYGRSLKIYTDAGGNVEVDLSGSVKLSIQDQARLIADMNVKGMFDVESRLYVIAEMALDSTSGLWVYMGTRPEKTRLNTPNFITTVMSTMVEVAEGLSEEELKYRMLSDPSSDDWVTQEMAMRKLAVKWKYGKSNK